MLVTESISVLIALGLTVLVMLHGGPPADLRAVDPIGDRWDQVRGGLMVAALSFVGFASAANLGSEAVGPYWVVPWVIRLAVA